MMAMFHPSSLLLLLVLVTPIQSAAFTADGVPSVLLKNAADSNVEMPAIGLGTGGYGNSKYRDLGVYPECWSDGKPDSEGTMGGVDCGKNVVNATLEWLMAGGKRIDNADSYYNMRAIGQAMQKSGLKREDMFLTSKVGSSLAMGTKEVFDQVKANLGFYQTNYIDLVLIHWPQASFNSTDPVCMNGHPSYDAKECRLDTYKALIELWKQKSIRAIGVSNYNIAQLQEIIDAGLPLPSVNQCPYNPHLQSAQKELVEFCKAHGILFNSYSPLGAPDWHKYPSSISTTGLIIEEPSIIAIGKKHALSAAQVIEAWQWGKGIVMNPRSMNPMHMKENLDPKVFTTVFNAADTAVLNGFKPDACDLTDESTGNHWYECCGDPSVQPSIPKC